jgi:hypothetical protein
MIVRHKINNTDFDIYDSFTLYINSIVKQTQHLHFVRHEARNVTLHNACNLMFFFYTFWAIHTKMTGNKPLYHSLEIKRN